MGNHTISNPPKRLLNDPVGLEAWRHEYRLKRSRQKSEYAKRFRHNGTYYPPIETLARVMWWTARKRAQRKKLKFEITMDWIRTRLVAGVCEATGIALDLSAGSRRMKAFAPSIDRRDAAGGYTLDNVWMVVCIHNMARGAWGDRILHEYIKKYLKHRMKTAHR